MWTKPAVLCPQWVANPLSDMYADVVTTVVLEVQSNPNAQKGEETAAGGGVARSAGLTRRRWCFSAGGEQRSL